MPYMFSCAYEIVDKRQEPENRIEWNRIHFSRYNVSVIHHDFCIFNSATKIFTNSLKAESKSSMRKTPSVVYTHSYWIFSQCLLMRSTIYLTLTLWKNENRCFIFLLGIISLTKDGKVQVGDFSPAHIVSSK